MGLVEKVAAAHLIIVDRVVERRDGVRYLGDEDHEEEDVGDIELPGATEDPGRGVERPLQCERPAIDESSGVTRDEDEHFRPVKELNRLDGEIAEDVLRNRIDEYDD